MAITLGSNILSLRARRSLDETSQDLSKVMERLSSGMRITSASDDPASLALSTKLSTDARVYAQGIKNLNDGISLLNIAEEALEQSHAIVTRIRELAEQASNGVYTSAQRGVLDSEAQLLAEEYKRILSTSSFNGITPYGTNSGTSVALQFGVGDSEQLTVDFGSLVTQSIGDGTFQAGVCVADGGVGSSDTKLVDLDGDGDLDLLLSRYNNASLRSYENDGQGNFTLLGTFAGNGPNFGLNNVEVGDFNGDGRIDVVVAETHPTATTMDVFFGNGDGTFGAVTTIVVGTETNYLTIDDFDGDGKIDIVGTGGSANPYVYVALSNGNGTFKAIATYSFANNANGIDSGDIDGDGDIDLVFNGGDTSHRTTILLNNGDGTFAAPSTIQNSSGPSSIELVDINDDGDLDIITSNGAGSSHVSVFLGNGNGTFGAQTTYSVGSTQGIEVLTGDFNGDGVLDLAASLGTSSAMAVLLGNGDGTFSAVVTYATSAGQSLSGFDLGDVNDDGSLDFIVAAGGGSTTIDVFLGNTEQISGLSFSLTSESSAREALESLAEAADILTQELGKIGATQSRISSIQSVMKSRVDGYREAAARITDVDYAEEEF